jgi:hypothetical protein
LEGVEARQSMFSLNPDTTMLGAISVPTALECPSRTGSGSMEIRIDPLEIGSFPRPSKLAGEPGLLAVLVGMRRLVMSGWRPTCGKELTDRHRNP